MTEKNTVKVTHLIPSLATGGMERLVCDMAVERGTHNTSIICLDELGALGKKLCNKINIHVIKISSIKLIAIIQTFFALYREKPDIVHCHNLRSHFYGGIYCFFANKCEIVMTKHGQYIPGNGIANKINKELLKNTHIICVSDDITKIMRNWLNNDKTIVNCISNGVPNYEPASSDILNKIRAELHINSNDITICMVARLADPKDHTILINAINNLRKKYTNLKLFIIGDGPNRQNIENLVTELDLISIVNLLGERNDVITLLQCMDIFVLTSKSEGIPMTILEAMSVSLPVIASDVGGIHSIVFNEKTGILVKPDSLHSLIDSIKRLIDNPAERDNFGKNAKYIIENNYSIRKIVSMYEQIYIKDLPGNQDLCLR